LHVIGPGLPAAIVDRLDYAMSLKKLIEMLHKQKLVDGMVHSQQMHKQEFV